MRKIKQILLLYRKTNFLIAHIFLSITCLIFLLGNPRFFGSSLFYWHHLPEIVFFYFLGRWFGEIGTTFFVVLCIYVLNAFSTPLWLGVFSVLNWLIVTGYCACLSSGVIIGYAVQKKKMEVKKYEEKP